jgi:Kef-type K+ transport system membrane component KefB
MPINIPFTYDSEKHSKSFKKTMKFLKIILCAAAIVVFIFAIYKYSTTQENWYLLLILAFFSGLGMAMNNILDESPKKSKRYKIVFYTIVLAGLIGIVYSGYYYYITKGNNWLYFIIFLIIMEIIFFYRNFKKKD